MPTVNLTSANLTVTYSRYLSDDEQLGEIKVWPTDGDMEPLSFPITSHELLDQYNREICRVSLVTLLHIVKAAQAQWPVAFVRSRYRLPPVVKELRETIGTYFLRNRPETQPAPAQLRQLHTLTFLQERDLHAAKKILSTFNIEWK